MDIYSGFIGIALVLAVLLPGISSRDEDFTSERRAYCRILGFILFLIAALRSTAVGNDSGQYAWIYYHVQQLSLANIVANYRETGFYLMLKLLTLVSKNHQIAFAAIGAIYAYFTSRFVYKYSKDPLVSFIMLISMMYFAFSLTGLRQTVAISILLFSIDFIVQRRFWPFVLSVLSACLFHQSAVFFVPAYFLAGRQVTTGKVLLYVLMAPFIFVFRPTLLRLVQLVLYSEYVADVQQSAGGWTTLLVYIAILIVAALLRISLNGSNHNFPFFFSMMYYGTIIQMFVPLEPNIFRVSMYYNIASIVLIPEVLGIQKDGLSRFVAYSVFLVLMGIQYYVFTYYAAGANPYSFFWQVVGPNQPL